MEEDLAATEITMGRSGRSKAQIDGVLRSKRAALAAAKRARGDLRMEEAGFRSTPPSMLADPTAPIRGEAGGVGSGGQGKAFQDMYPVDSSGRKPLPTRTPLPPQRPAGMVSQSGGDDLGDILGGTVTPKVDMSEVEAAGKTIDAAKDKMTELGGTTAAPTVSAASIDAYIGKVTSAISLTRQLEGAADGAVAAMGRFGAAGRTLASAPTIGRTASVASAVQNSRTDRA